jgi:hypothetical protein
MFWHFSLIRWRLEPEVKVLKTRPTGLFVSDSHEQIGEVIEIETEYGGVEEIGNKTHNLWFLSIERRFGREIFWAMWELGDWKKLEGKHQWSHVYE